MAIIIHLRLAPSELCNAPGYGSFRTITSPAVRKSSIGPISGGFKIGRTNQPQVPANT
jgi:hypothetical protein